MIAEFIITFRETLEAALIIGIILSYLIKTKQTKYNNIVYLAIVAALVGSIIGAFLFNSLAGGFTGRAEEIFEGVVMLIGAFLLTFMIMWMMKQMHIVKDLYHKLSENVNKAHKVGLFFLVFVAVLREGIETVIFLGAASFVSEGSNLFGALLGLVTAIIIGYLIFVAAVRINIHKFFRITTVLLILFAAGLVSHGIHELQEAKLVPIVNEHVFDINPEAPLADQGIYPALHEKGSIGGIFKELFGYNGNPSLIEILSYIIYIIAVILLWRNINAVHKVI